MRGPDNVKRVASLLPPPPTIMRSRLPSYVDTETPKPASRLPWGLALGALGVVYGDLGTNPLFALGEAFGGEHPVGINRLAILGVLSLIFWSLTLVVAVKYINFVMRASNDGEGGILALLALIPSNKKPHLLVVVILCGASLLYGDGVVTPAISVLSAVEGLKGAAPGLQPWIVPITIAILVGLFVVQRKGTQAIGFAFGPVMVVWFLAIAVLGAAQIVRTPVVLEAVDPRWAVRYFLRGGLPSFSVLGAVILCVAGSEDLYADMGHFGRRPIMLAWYGLVLPSLVLTYFGQGAFLLSGGTPQPSVFYAMVPAKLLLPMILLSASATVIASQALVSGAFSLTQQAVQLGFSPRVTVVHTHEEHSGQIYVPEVNWALMVACILLVAQFRSSDKLAAAYGLAVTGTMTVTSIAFFVLATRAWRWAWYRAVPLCLLFLTVDVTYLISNLRKFWDGGWVPFSIGLAVFTLFTTWITGRRRLGARLAEYFLPLEAFLDDVRAQHPPRVRGAAVFLTANPNGVPVLLLHHFKHNQVLHEKVVLLTVASEHTPYVKPSQRLRVEEVGEGFYRLQARFGFMESPNVPQLLAASRDWGLLVDLERTTYYLGRETLIASKRPGMARWRKRLFAFVSRNARSATDYFGIPPNRVVELGMQVEL